MAGNHLEIDGKRYLLVSDYNRRDFKVEKIEESIATKKTIKIISKYIHQYNRPYFLLVKASK